MSKIAAARETELTQIPRNSNDERVPPGFDYCSSSDEYPDLLAVSVDTAHSIWDKNKKKNIKAIFPTDSIISSLLAASPAGVLTVLLLFSPGLYGEDGIGTRGNERRTHK